MPCTPDQFEYATQRENSKVGNERATRDRVLDELTLKTLKKLINTDHVIDTVEGCVSSGKEANVYHCTAPIEDQPHGELQETRQDRVRGDEQDEGQRKKRLAVKVYATTVNVFKKRQVYMQGWHNFDGVRQGRQMVGQWATNEFNHLKRLHEAKIPCPEPVAHRDNVLVMSLLSTDDGEAFPILQHATVESDQEWTSLYVQLLCNMRRMYQISRLVHGDLSEYNILYNDGTLYFIDVSQSLEHSNPQSLNMLRRDMENMNAFFQRKGVQVLSEASLFDFLTNNTTPTDLKEMKGVLEKLWQDHETAKDDEDCAEAEVEESFFRNKSIARTLEEAYEHEMMGYEVDSSAIRIHLADTKAEDEEEEGSDHSSLDDEDGLAIMEGGTSLDASKRPRGKKHIPQNEKHEHKMRVKEEKKERRRTKMPKKVKKALVAATKRDRRK